MVIRILYVALLLGLHVTSSPSAQAQPTVTNEVAVADQQDFILITFLQNDLQSMNGCHYNIFAADQKKDLKELPGKGLSIATFLRNEPEVNIIAGPLKQLKKSSSGPLSKRNVKIYLRTLISCPEATNGYGEIVSFTVHPKRGGNFTAVDRLLWNMKFHMRYYN